MIRDFCGGEARGVRGDEVPPAARGLSQGGPGGRSPPGKNICQTFFLIFHMFLKELELISSTVEKIFSRRIDLAIREVCS